MKKWKIYVMLGVLTGGMLAAGTVCAEETVAESETMENVMEEEDPYIMISGETYEMDLDGDGTMETVSYESFTAEVPATVEKHGFEGVWSCADMFLYVNGESVGELMEEDWSYQWKVCQCPMENGKTYLVAESTGDNDWTSSLLLLSVEDGEIVVVADLLALTREEAEGDGRLISGWGRGGDVAEIGETTFKVKWCDALMSAGNLVFPVEYEVTEEGVVQKDGPYALDAEQEWTPLTDIPVVKEPGSEEEVFTAVKGEKIHLTAITKVEGVYYLQCETTNGDIGWIRDLDEMLVHEDGTYSYFAESLFAG